MNYKHGHAVGYRTSPTLKSWQHMISRCLKPSDRKYPLYGGRGITVCERWLDFQSFLEDMGDRPAGTTLGRIDNDGNYEPNNCQWETPKQQANNRSYNHEFEYKGKKYNMRQLADELGVSYYKMYFRWKRGCSLEEMTEPSNFKTGPKNGRT